MIEQIAIQLHRDGTFTSHYIGARSIHDATWKQESADSSRLADFETLLTEHGFAMTNRNDEFGLRFYSRYDGGLALGIGE
jgi:hypothetical protein